MNIGILFSGGKDSVFTTYYYQQQGWTVSCLVTLLSEHPDSWMFHTPNISLTSLQAQAMHIPLLHYTTPGVQEEELAELRDALLIAKKQFHITGLAVGALASDYQHERVNRVCEEVGLKCFAPLWHKDQQQLLAEMIDAGFSIIIQHIASDCLDCSWLGKVIDRDMYQQLVALHAKMSFHVAGEGGEFETLVVDGPNFYTSLLLTQTTIVREHEYCGTLVITDAQLV